MRAGDALKGIDQEKETGLHAFIKKMPEDETLSLEAVRGIIERGRGALTETELLFLFLDAVTKGARGEVEW